MKKFIVASVLVAVAGIGFGVARRQEPAAPAALAAETTTTAAGAASPAAQAEPATTPKALTKVTSTTRPRTTTTTAKAVSVTTAPTQPASVTPTTVPAATASSSTTTTTTTVAAVTPTCSASVASPTAAKGTTQEVRVSSNMPANKTRITVQYPQFGTGKPNPRQTFTPTTDGDGSVTQAFNVIATSTVPVPVVVEFYDAEGRISGHSCQTSFDAPA